jgi:hypothetical protein
MSHIDFVWFQNVQMCEATVWALFIHEIGYNARDVTTIWNMSHNYMIDYHLYTMSYGNQ